MGASTRGPASRSEKAVITVWLRSGVGWGGLGGEGGPRLAMRTIQITKGILCRVKRSRFYPENRGGAIGGL